ncbi:MAG: vitamin B12-binding protein [Lactobacillus ruminis]|nr:vitamin B12-binding protein [Ligilactobacillus ruminis]
MKNIDETLKFVSALHFARNRGTGFYGQISRISILPVTAGCHLQANLKNQHFARNSGLDFTGRIQKSPICP